MELNIYLHESSYLIYNMIAPVLKHDDLVICHGTLARACINFVCYTR